MRHRLYLSGASHVTKVEGRTFSITSSVRNVCPNVEPVHGVMTMWISLPATLGLLRDMWRSETFRLTPSTALRFRPSMESPTRVPMHLSLPLLTSPPTRLVSWMNCFCFKLVISQPATMVKKKKKHCNGYLKIPQPTTLTQRAQPIECIDARQLCYNAQ